MTARPARRLAGAYFFVALPLQIEPAALGFDLAPGIALAVLFLIWLPFLFSYGGSEFRLKQFGKAELTRHDGAASQKAGGAYFFVALSFSLALFITKFR
jgi:hypothetical protein